jgi:hypothetical protein
MMHFPCQGRGDPGKQDRPMNGASWSAGMEWVKRVALAFALLAPWSLGVRAADTIVVMLHIEDPEIITSDRKRLRLAEPAEVRFAVTTPYIAQVFGDDLTIPRNLMRLTVLASARRVLGELPATEAIKPEAARAIVADIDRVLAYLGVSVESHTLRYTLVPPLAPEPGPPR